MICSTVGSFIVINACSINVSSEALDSLLLSSELLSIFVTSGKTILLIKLFCFRLTSLPTLPINYVTDGLFVPSGLNAAFFFFYSSLAATFREELAFKVAFTFDCIGDFLVGYYLGVGYIEGGFSFYTFGGAILN